MVAPQLVRQQDREEQNRIDLEQNARGEQGIGGPVPAALGEHHREDRGHDRQHVEPRDQRSERPDAQVGGGGQGRPWTARPVDYQEQDGGPDSHPGGERIDGIRAGRHQGEREGRQ